MSKNIFAVCLFWTIFVIFSQNTFACQCFENFTPLIVDYAKAESVFVGKVINIKKFGNESEKEAYYPKHRTVEFEIQKIYKGTISSSERITLNTNFNAASCGFAQEDGEAPKSGQKWVVFVRKNQENNRLYFGGMCDPSIRIEKPPDISAFESRIFSVKDKQAVVGSIVN